MDFERKIIQLYLSKDKFQQDKKLITLLKLMFIDKINDLEVILKIIPANIATLNRYIKEPEYVLKYLTQEEFILFESRINKIKEIYEYKKEQNRNIQEKENFKNTVFDILNTRYKLEDICKKNGITRIKFNEMLNDKKFVESVFGEGYQEKTKEKIRQNSLIRRTQNMYVVEDKFSISVAKEDIIYLNKEEYRMLIYASHYLFSGADIDFVKKTFGVDFSAVMPFISSSKLELLMKPNYYKILRSYIDVEKILLGNDLKRKKELMNEIVSFLFQNNFNKEIALLYYNLPEKLFDRLLEEILKHPSFNQISKSEIQKLVQKKDEIKYVK